MRHESNDHRRLTVSDIKFEPDRKFLSLLLLTSLIVITSSKLSADQELAASEVSLQAFATRYAAAWSSQDPQRLALHYAEDGMLQVNGGKPALGRAAIEAKASSFMEAFPDMVVSLESVEPGDGTAIFRWLWTGTNTGPGGTGRAVRLRGYEEWTFDQEGLIRISRGHYDEAEYQRQVEGVESVH